MIGGGEIGVNRVTGEASGPLGKPWVLGKTYYRVASSKYHRDYTQEYRDMTQTNFNYSITHKFADTTLLWLEMDYTRKAMHRGNQVPFYTQTVARPIGTGTYTKILDYAYDLMRFSLDGPDEYNNRVMRQMSGEFQHRFNETFSLRLAGSKWNREFHRERAALSTTLNITASPRVLTRSTPSYSYINEYGGGAQIDLLARYKTATVTPIRHQSLLTLDYRRDGGKNHIRNLSAGQSADPAVRGKTSVNIDTATAADYDIYEFSQPPANYLAPGNPTRNISNVLGIYGRHTLYALPEERLVVTGGYRYDNSDVKNITYADPVVFATPTNSRTTKSHAARPHAGAVYKLLKGLSVYASYSESFNLNTATNNAGARLPAESGKSKEVGIKTGLFEDRLNLTLSFYDLRRTNVVVTELVDPVNNITDNVVDGAQRSKGIDLDGTWVIQRNLQLVFSGSILNSEVTDAGLDLDRVGRATSRTPKRQLGLAAKYGVVEGPFKGVAFLLGMNYRDKAFPDLGGQQDFNNDRLNSPGENDNRRNVFVPAVTIWNAGAVYRLRPKGSRFTHTVQLNLNNAFNKRYIDVAGRAADLRFGTMTYSVKF
jgi:outer membrane receptor protein involved in Fe transport